MLQLEAPVNPLSLMAQGQQIVPDVAAQAAQRQLLQAQAAEAQQNLQFRNIALQRQQSFGSDMQNFLTSPSVSGVAAMFGKYPEFQQQIQDAWGTLSAEQKRSELTQLGSAAALTAKGDYDGAADLVQSRIQADQAAGRDTSTLQQMQALLQTKDPTKITPVLGMMSAYIAGGVGADKAADYLKSIGLSQEPQKLSPGEREVNTVTGQTVASSPALSTAQVLNTPSGGQQLYSFNPNDGSINGGGGSAASTQPGGGGQTSGGGAAYPPGTPRSVRNNNPGNLKATPFTRGLPGYSGVDNAGYAIFSSPDQGLAAQTQLLSGKAYFAGGKNTVASIVSKWAPSKAVGGDNSPAQTANYISYVSQALGVKPNDVLSPQQLPQLAQAMSQFEAGATHGAGAVRVPPAAPQVAQNGSPGNVSAPVSGPQPLVSTDNSGALDTKGAPEHMMFTHDPVTGARTGVAPIPGDVNDPNQYQAVIDPAARQWLYTGEFPTGGGMGAGGALTLAEKNNIVKAGLQLWAAAGHKPEDLKTFRSQYGGLNSSLQDAIGTLSTLQATQESLQSDANLVLSAHRNLMQTTTNNSLMHIRDGGLFSTSANEKTIDYLEKNGTPAEQQAAKQYKDAVNAYSQTYTKFMLASTGGKTSAAQPSDSAREASGELNDIGMGPTALRAHLQLQQAEIGNKVNGWAKRKELLSNQLSSLGGLPNGPSAQSSQPAVNIPAGAVQMLKSNPNLAPMFDQKYGAGKASQILGQ